MFFLTFLVRSADKTDEDRIVGECENNSEKKNRTPFLLSELWKNSQRYLMYNNIKKIL